MAAEIPAIRVDHVSKTFRRYKDRPGSLKEMITKFRMERYENFRAVDDVSLQVEHGEVFGLVGHNGSGKSTLLKMMANIHRPTSGTITTDGRISALLRHLDEVVVRLSASKHSAELRSAGLSERCASRKGPLCARRLRYTDVW